MNGSARSFAGLIAVAGVVALGLQAYSSFQLFAAVGQGVGAALWRLAGYFTILTNVLVFMVMTAVAAGARNRSVRPSFVLGGVTLFIAVVGLIYHALLRDLIDLSGWAEIADIGLHYVVPILTVVFWVAFAPKSDLVYRDAVVWLIYPLTYCAYALTRGAASNWYPYPFIDVPALGIGRVFLNVVMLSGGFLVLGCALIFVGRRLDSKT